MSAHGTIARHYWPSQSSDKHDWREAKTWRPRECEEGQQMVRKRLLLTKREGNAQARP